MNIDESVMRHRISEIKRRSHNLPPDLARQSMDEALESLWHESMHKVEHYVAGSHLLEPRADVAYFNTLSLGNWITLAATTGVRHIPARLVGVINPIVGTKMAMGHVDQLTEGETAELGTLVNNLQSMKSSEMLRFDPCAGLSVKHAMATDGIPSEQTRGVDRGPNGILLPIFMDSRLADAFLNWTDCQMPVWVRPWVKAMRLPSPMADHTVPAEWRIFIQDGAITAASLYYVHEPIEPSDLKRLGLPKALDSAKAILAGLEDLKLIPHHPRYEHRPDLNTSRRHFTLDFLITPEGEPLLLEGGPAHLRNPNWGAHPVQFGSAPPAGIALGGGRTIPADFTA